MLEILFRGRRIDSGKWVQGAFVPDALEMLNGVKGLNGFIRRYNLEIGEIEMFEVDREAVGEYTGVTDKNKVMIFEGDIVKFFGMQGKIVFREGAFGIAVLQDIDWNLLEKEVPLNNSPCFCCNDNFISLWEIYWNWEIYEKFEQDDNSLYEVEVIGNIHDNPELLNGG